MKLWIDDVRPAPDGYFWCKSVKGAKQLILYNEAGIKHYNAFLKENKELPEWQLNGISNAIKDRTIDLIDIDHDAGDYASDGGDYIKLLDWFEETGLNYPIRIHSMNPIGVANMRAIIERNGWKEIR